MRNGTVVKVVVAILISVGVLGGGVMISQQDADQMVEIAVMKDDQSEMKQDIQELKNQGREVMRALVRIEAKLPE